MAQLDEAKSRTARMYDLLASSYNHIVPFFTDFGEQLVAEASVQEGERVLDVATGQGACLIPAAAAVGPTGAVVGIDISAGMIEVLDRSINAAGLRQVDVELMDAEALTFEDCSFDVVTCAFALFHLDRVRVLPGFARVLKPGGRAAFSTFDNDALGYPWFAEVVAPFLPAEGPQPDAAARVLHIDQDELVGQLHDAGFEQVSSRVVERQYHFTTASEHWDWLMSNGHRVTIDRVEPGRVDALKGAVTQRLEEHRDARGYQFDKPIRFTLASRSAP